jgi:dipeptidyl aminopeptidase/acylaminoacyl peptidase
LSKDMECGIMHRDAGPARRVEAIWQAAVLFLVLLLTFGIYIALGWVVNRLYGGRAPVADTLLLLDPEPGSVFQVGLPVPVQAAVTEPGYLQAEFYVDGRRQDVVGNPDLQVVPWLAAWSWLDGAEGEHTLVVRVGNRDGQWVSSSPLTVTVVPAGRLLFASNRDGAYAAYSQATDGHDVERLSLGPGDTRQPRGGPDGTLAFVAEDGQGRPRVHALSPEGQPLEALAGTDPAWSPAGNELAFAATVDGVSQVFVVVPGGAGRSAPRQITAEEGYAGQPAWSPDGVQLAYVAEREDNWDIWTVPAAGGEPQRLTEDPAVDWAPAWSPDGTRLAFVSNRSGSHQLHLMLADGTGARAITDLARGAESPAWSPDGFWLAFVGYGGEGSGINAREIYLVRSDGEHRVRLTANSYDDTDVTWLAEH